MCLLAMAVSGFLFAASAYNIDRVISSNVTIHFPNYKLENDVSASDLLIISNNLFTHIPNPLSL